MKKNIVLFLIAVAALVGCSHEESKKAIKPETKETTQKATREIDEDKLFEKKRLEKADDFGYIKGIEPKIHEYLVIDTETQCYFTLDVSETGSIDKEPYYVDNKPFCTPVE